MIRPSIKVLEHQIRAFKIEDYIHEYTRLHIEANTIENIIENLFTKIGFIDPPKYNSDYSLLSGQFIKLEQGEYTDEKFNMYFNDIDRFLPFLLSYGNIPFHAIVYSEIDDPFSDIRISGEIVGTLMRYKLTGNIHIKDNIAEEWNSGIVIPVQTRIIRKEGGINDD